MTLRLQTCIYLLAAGSAFAQPAVNVPTAPLTPEMPVTTLPQITLPATAPMPEPVAEPVPVETPVAALPTVPEVTASLPANDFSYGNAPSSLFFTPAQISAMKKALNAFENLRPEDAAAGEVLFTEELPVAPVKIEEPTTYPVYHLSSIVYHTPNDWTVWLNGARITPKMNDGEVQVTAVKPDRAWFSWQPTYIQPLVERINQKNFASTDPVKHRFSAENTANFDRQTGTIRFSLRPNQSFSAGYFRTFEGKVAAPTIAAPLAPGEGPMSPQAAEAISGLLGATAAPTPVDPDRAAMENIISNQRIMPQAAGRNAPSSAAPQSPIISQPNTITSAP